MAMAITMAMATTALRRIYHGGNYAVAIGWRGLHGKVTFTAAVVADSMARGFHGGGGGGFHGGGGGVLMVADPMAVVTGNSRRYFLKFIKGWRHSLPAVFFTP